MIERRSKAMALSRTIKASVGESGGITWERRQFLCRVDIELDVDALMELIGRRALGNKSRSSRLLGGLIKGQVKVGNEIE